MIQVSPFGQCNGHVIDKITLSNEHITTSFINFGARMTELNVADRDGNVKNIVLNYLDIAGYQKDTSYLGAVCGRFANRIREGRISLDGETFQLDQNEGVHHLHGGKNGFHQRIWEYEISQAHTSVCFTLNSPHLDMGYPGTCLIKVTFRLIGNEIRCILEGTTDQSTLLNLTPHNYFNLSGDFRSSICEHTLKIEAEQVTVTDDDNLPTGELLAVQGTQYDFRAERLIDNKEVFSQSQKGYDSNYVLSGKRNTEHLACQLSDAKSGRKLEIYTTEPGLQVYTGGYLSNDGVYNDYSGIALEPQNFPDSPNINHFPNSVYTPEKSYFHAIKMVLSCDR